MRKILCSSILMAGSLFANEAIIEDVQVSKVGETYTLAVRILHKDSGWEHYVNGYDVLDTEGHVLATRTLWHPHEHEQPFTRSLSGVKLHEKETYYIRAHDTVDGYSKTYEIRVH